MKTRTTLDRNHLPRSFQELNNLHGLRPIRDRVDFENAQEMADALAVLDKRTRDQDEYLETLSILIERYESDHSPITKGDLSPVETLRYLMDAQGMSESDLGRVLGERSLGNAILSGRRTLSKTHARKLADHFKVNVGLFV